MNIATGLHNSPTNSLVNNSSLYDVLYPHKPIGVVTKHMVMIGAWCPEPSSDESCLIRKWWVLADFVNDMSREVTIFVHFKHQTFIDTNRT